MKDWRVAPGVAGGAAVAVLGVHPPWASPVLTVLGGAALLALLAAARRFCVGDPWRVACAGLAALALSELVRGAESAPTALAEIATIAGFGILVAGLVQLVQRLTDEPALDVLIVGSLSTLAIGGLGWAALTAVDERETSWSDGALAFGTVTVGALAVALAIRLRARATSDDAPRHLVVGLSCLVGAHIARAASLVTGVSSATWPMILVAAALAAWMATASKLTGGSRAGQWAVPPTGTSPTFTPGRITLLAGSVLLGPAVLVGSSVHELRAVPLATLSVVTSALAVTHLVRVARDRNRFEHETRHDQLTTLPNRRLLIDRLSAATTRGESVAVMFLDLDRFKKVNDSLGHGAGNELLVQVATRLRATMPARATVARLGGDEFGVLVPVATRAEAVDLAHELTRAFVDPVVVSGRTVFVGASVGQAVAPHDGSESDVLLARADTAMYRAKARGGNTVVFYEPSMDAVAIERFALESSLHAAVNREEFTLQYQPKVDLRTGAVVGVEALLRWNHPRLGTVPPSEFIPLAEETGLIVPLGEWVLETACRQASEWEQRGLGPLSVAVNVSARQFQQPGLADMVARTLRVTGLAPSRLELELTESLALEEIRPVQTLLQELKDIGVQCSIDDFGMGYSALGYLTRFPIDKLKIDKTFVRGIGEEDAAIVVAVIAMAHSLGLEVIAEGVETEEQLQFLREHGCDVMQGYLYSRPLDAAALETLLSGAAPDRHAAASAVPIPRGSNVDETHGPNSDTPAALMETSTHAPTPRRTATVRGRSAIAFGATALAPLVVGLASAGALPAPVQAVAASVVRAVDLAGVRLPATPFTSSVSARVPAPGPADQPTTTHVAREPTLEAAGRPEGGSGHSSGPHGDVAPGAQPADPLLDAPIPSHTPSLAAIALAAPPADAAGPRSNTTPSAPPLTGRIVALPPPDTASPPTTMPEPRNGGALPHKGTASTAGLGGTPPTPPAAGSR